MLKGPGLVVSLPARELTQFVPSSSLFDLTELRNVPLSHELRAAVELARQTCARNKVRLLLIARPEIFTHGVSLEWLRRQLGGIEDHLCISDGTAVRPIPQLRNHLFLYRLGNVHNATAFQRLCRCAPELMGTMHSQVNTCLSFRVGRKMVSPPTILLQVDATPSTQVSPKYYAHIHHASIETSIERILRAEARLTAKACNFEHLTYVPMTEAASKDQAFARKVAEAIAKTYSKPSCGVVLRMPRLHTAAPVEERLKAALEVVRVDGLKHPRAPSPSVLFVTEDPPSDYLYGVGGALDLLMHSSFEFWSHPVGYYAPFRKLHVIGSQVPGSNRIALNALLNSALGREIELRSVSSRPDAERALP